MKRPLGEGVQSGRHAQPSHIYIIFLAICQRRQLMVCLTCSDFQKWKTCKIERRRSVTDFWQKTSVANVLKNRSFLKGRKKKEKGQTVVPGALERAQIIFRGPCKKKKFANWSNEGIQSRVIMSANWGA